MNVCVWCQINFAGLVAALAALCDKKSLLFIAFNRGFDKAKLETNVKNIVPDKIDNPDAFKLWLSKEFSNFVLNKMLRKYGGQKQLAEVLKVFYHDTSNMVVFGYHISDRQTEDTIITIDPENFSLPALTFLEENYKDDIDDEELKLLPLRTLKELMGDDLNNTTCDVAFILRDDVKFSLLDDEEKESLLKKL